MVLQWSQQTVVGPHRIAIYKSVKKHSATGQMSQTQAQLVKGFSNTSASAGVITVDSSANVGINKTSPVKDLDVTGEIRASTGMLFGTDTAAANTLDDYEEGDWTPSIQGSTAAGTASYSFQLGSYEKIGRQVTVRGHVDFSSATGTGNMQVAGLPYTSNPASFASIQPGPMMIADVTFPSGKSYANAYVPNGSNKVSVFCSGSNSTYAPQPMEAAGKMIFSITYSVA